MTEHNQSNDLGAIRIVDEVVSKIAGLAAMEVEGVTAMSGGYVSGGIAQMLGRKNLTKGVKVEVGEKETTIGLSMIIQYGKSIPQVCNQVQEAVVKAVEGMTGLKVLEVNINVQGISFQEEEPPGEEEQ